MKAFKALKHCIVALALSLVYAGYCSAGVDDTRTETRTVEATGRGPDREAAINNAISIAGERAFGVYVFANSRLKNGQEIEHFSSTVTAGLIDGFSVESEEKIAGGYTVTIQAKFSTAKTKALARRLKMTTPDDQLADIAMIGAKQERLKAYAKLLNSLTNGPRESFIKSAYSFDIGEYGTSQYSPDEVSGYFTIKIQPNMHFWETYYKVISLLDDEAGTISEGPLGSINLPDCRFYGSTKNILASTRTSRIQGSLSRYLAQPIKIRVAVGNNPSSQYWLYKEGVFNFLPMFGEVDDAVLSNDKCGRYIASERVVLSSLRVNNRFQSFNTSYLTESTASADDPVDGDRKYVVRGEIPGRQAAIGETLEVKSIGRGKTGLDMLRQSTLLNISID